jgi:chromosome segregation ATPase
MNAFLLLLVVTSTLVLRSGDRITVEGAVREENGVMTFRSDGVLFSLPASEVDRVELNEMPEGTESSDPAPDASEAKRKLKVSAEERRRLLDALSKNRGGVAPQQTPEKPVARKSERELRREKEEESTWRRRARSHEEAVRRAIEDLELLENRINELESKIASLTSLGYHPTQFTYDTSQLLRTRERLPQARLEIQRAQRAYDEFREEARREGVLPGWLR